MKRDIQFNDLKNIAKNCKSDLEKLISALNKGDENKSMEYVDNIIQHLLKVSSNLRWRTPVISHPSNNDDRSLEDIILNK